MKRKSKVIISLILILTLSIMLIPEVLVTSVNAAAINEDGTGRYHLVIESNGFQIVGGGNGAELKKDTKELRVYVEDNKGNRYTPYYVSCSTMYGTSEDFSIDASFDFDERNKLDMTIKGTSGSKFWLMFDHVYFYTDDDLCEHVLYTDDNSERYYVTLTDGDSGDSTEQEPEYHMAIYGDGLKLVDDNYKDNTWLVSRHYEYVRGTKIHIYVEDKKGNRYHPTFINPIVGTPNPGYGLIEAAFMTLPGDMEYHFGDNECYFSYLGKNNEFYFAFNNEKLMDNDYQWQKVKHDGSFWYITVLDSTDDKGSDVETTVNGNGTSNNETPTENKDVQKNNSSTTIKRDSMFTQGAYEYGNVSTKNKEVTLCGVKPGVVNVNVPATVTYQGVTYKVKGISLSGNKKIKKVVIGKNVTDLTFAFDGCTALKKVTFAKGTKLKTIQSFAFRKCKSLKKIKLPSTLKYIRSNAFCESGLTSVTIPKNVETIGPSAFEKCKNLKKVVIGNGVYEIRDSAFYNCKKLEKVTIGKGVMKIKKYAFGFCKSLKNVKIKAWSAKIGKDSFYGTSKKIVLTVPKGYKPEYRAQIKKAGLSNKTRIKY